MSLGGAAAALGLPETLVQRSAEARAAETGQSVDDILAAWAGGEAIAADTGPVADPSATEDNAAVEAKEAQTEASESESGPEPAQSDGPSPSIPTGVAAPEPATSGAPTRAPVPAEVTAMEAAHLPEVITVPTAGIKERTNFVMPKWLTGLMLAVPLFALFALGGSSTGACGEATELATDVITGQIVNCDGSEFTGSGIGGGDTNFIALGEQIYGGSAVAGVNCAGCHGANGQGSGAFPALNGVLTTFGSCADHIEWVTLGSAGFPDGYGDTNKPTAGGMPAFSGSLTPEQIAAVSAFERVRFGGAGPDEALVDCGLVEAEGEGDGTTGSTLSGDEGGPTPTSVPTDADAEAAASISGS